MKRRFAASLAVALCAGLVTSAHGQAFSQASYNIVHNFNWNPPAGATGLPLVTGYWFQHVWIRDRACPAPFWEFADVRPTMQNPGFDMMGTDYGFGIGSMNTGLGVPVPCRYSYFNIPDTGVHWFNCLTLPSPCSGTSATACVGFDVGAYAIGTPVSGQIRSNGGVIASGMAAQAYAYSSAGVTIQARNAQGQVLWTPFMDGVSGSAGALAVRRDPLVLTVFGPGGSARATLLDIEYRTNDTDRFSWANDVWSTDGQEVEFWISIPPQATLNPGELLLQIRNGIVVTSQSSGSLAMPMPPIGALSPLSFWLPNAMSINYDGSGLLPGQPITRTTLDMLGGGDAPANFGCPADFDGDGSVDFFDYDQFVQCFEGLICPPERNADFDGDGTVDFFDYDAFVIAFETPC
ncbi:MAG: hypothetical protein AABZ53_03915 [Planctomycetota bacterium]